MIMERVLGVSIGLAITYLFLAIVVLAITEAISGLFGLRAKRLKAGLEHLLKWRSSNDVEADFTALLKKPLIATLGYATLRTKDWPSYIPTSLFAKAFLDTVGALRAKGADVNDAYQAALLALPSDAAREYVTSIVGAAVTTVEEAEQRVGRWFDAAMDQMSGRYRRHIQWVTRGVALVVVIAVNANTLSIGATFWRASGSRQAASEFATTALKRCEAKTGATPDHEVTLKEACPELLEAAAEKLPLPLGWTHDSCRAAWDFPLQALLGLLLSFIAVSFGAPFWFDALRRLIPSLPLTGPKPAASPPADEGAPADPRDGR
jgi:hypothetical protein